MTHSSSEFPDTAFSAASRLQDLEQVLERERRRKLLLIVPVAGVIGTAVVLKATWALAVAATGMIGLQAWRRGH
jgi:hypothetical protein